MDVLKNLDILNAKFIEGLYFSFSNEIIVCLETPKISANSSWVKFDFSLFCLIIFFTLAPPTQSKASFT